MNILNRFKLFLMKDSENNILYTLWGLCTISIIWIFFMFPNYISDKPQYYTELLLVNAQILATIFAITTSFAIFGLQYVSQDLSPRIMNYFIKSKEFLLFFGSYGIGIILNLFVVSFPKIIALSTFIYLSLIILISCLFLLIFYLKFMIRGIQLKTIIDSVKKNIPNDFGSIIVQRELILNRSAIVLNDPFIEFEQIIIRAIRNNDHTSFSYCLQQICALNFKYLEQIQQSDGTPGYKSVWKQTEALQNYFFRYYNQILFEILNQNNERLLDDYIAALLKTTEYLFDLKCNFSIEQFENHFHEIGKLIIDKNYYRFSSNYFNAAYHLLETEFLNLPSGNDLSLYENIHNAIDIPRMSERDKDLWYFGETTHDRFFSELDFILKLAERVKFEEFFSIFSFLNYKLEKLVILSIKKTDNDTFRSVLVSNLFNSQIRIYECALRKQTNSGLNLIFFLKEISDNPDKYDITSLQNLILKLFSDLGGLSVKYYDATGISCIGRAVRFLIHKYPDFSSSLVDLLILCSETVRQSQDNKKNFIQNQIIRELISIKHHNKEKIETINRKIDSELVNLPPIQQ